MKETILNLPEKSGIYKITSPNGKVYIGESVNLKNRCKFYLSPNRIKKQRALYNSLLKYGVNQHFFEVIEFCDVTDLKERERHFQEFYNSVNNGLNCFYSSTKNKLKKHSEETIMIMSIKSSGTNNPFYGKKHTDESLEKISVSSKGINNPNYGGKFINDEYIKKQIISNSKKPLRVTDTITGDFFDFINSKECAIFLGVPDSSIRTSKAKGWKIKKRFTIQDIK